MDRPALRRREFLIGAAAGAGMLLHGAPAAGAGRPGPLIPRRLLFVVNDWPFSGWDGGDIGHTFLISACKQEKPCK